jgi:hypothetical protein
MNEQEFILKYKCLGILKSTQEYLKTDEPEPPVLYPIRLPGELLSHIMTLHTAEELDQLIHSLFRRGLGQWAEELYQTVFGTPRKLERFIERVKKEGEDKT